jgi:DNA-binding MarR family transcriptional regulator
MKSDDKPRVGIPNPGEGKRGEQGHIGYLVRQASHAIRAGIERALEDLDVTQPQFLVMTMVGAYPGCSGADVARLTMLTPQTISLIIANLEREGRLVRTLSPEHGRVRQMRLTDEGLNLLAQCRRRTSQIEAKLIASMPPGAESAIRRWLIDATSLDFTVDPT